MWNYSNVIPVEQVFENIVRKNIEQFTPGECTMSQYKSERFNTFKIFTKHHQYTKSALPLRIVCLDIQNQRIYSRGIDWRQRRDGRVYPVTTSVLVHKYGMKYYHHARRYYALDSDDYIEKPVVTMFGPSFQRYSSDEAIKLLCKRYGKKFTYNIVGRNNHQIGRILKTLTKSQITRVQQVFAKEPPSHEIDILILTPTTMDVNYPARPVTVMLHDYIQMCYETKTPIKLGLSMRRYGELHDELIQKQNRKDIERATRYAAKLNINKSLVVEHPDLELITDTGRLQIEGIIQHHCVSSYSGEINRGNCAIYSTKFDGSQYTVEIRSDAIRQIKGKYNTKPPIELAKKLYDIFGLPITDAALVDEPELVNYEIQL